MFDAVLFDLDGTLADSSPGLLNALRHMHGTLEMPVPDETELLTWLGPPLATILRERGHSDETAAAGVVAMREYLLERGFDEQELFDGIPQLLDDLRHAGVATAIATFKLQSDAELVAERFALASRMGAVHGRTAAESGHSKAMVIGRAIETLGLMPSRSIAMVGDRKHDIASAAELGLTSIGVSYGYGSESELRAAGADSVVHSVPELRSALGLPA